MTNTEIIKKLRRLDTLLKLKKCSNNLAVAVRSAIENIEGWDFSVEERLKTTQPRILFPELGPKFIRIFDELIKTGDIAMIHALQPEFDPFFCDLCEIPGIGETMARRMFFDRSIRSMDDLRIAYTNNILQKIPSFGEARFKAIEAVLWHSQGKDHPSWGEIPMSALLPPEEEEPEIMGSQLELFTTDALKTAQTQQPDAPAPDIPKAYTPAAAQADTPADDTDARDDKLREQARSLTELFEELDRRAETMSSGLCHPIEMPAANEAHTPREDHYSQEFRTSNSFLFRESPHADVSDPEREADLLLKTESEQDLDAQIEHAVQAIPPEDPQIAAQLKDTIAKDLAEHGLMLHTPDAAPLCAQNIIARSIYAKRLVAENIRARVLSADIVRLQHTDIEDPDLPLLNGDLRADEIQAHTVDADFIEAHEVWCHVLSAHIVRQK